MENLGHWIPFFNGMGNWSFQLVFSTFGNLFDSWMLDY